MFHGGRAYIIEFDRERRTHDCTYEVTAENVTAEQDLVNSLSMDEVPWWTRRIENGNPIIISSLDELPDEAFREKEVLAMQDIKSLIAVPLASRDQGVGIRRHRHRERTPEMERGGLPVVRVADEHH